MCKKKPKELYDVLYDFHDASYGEVAIEVLKWVDDNLPKGDIFRSEIKDWINKKIDKYK